MLVRKNKMTTQEKRFTCTNCEETLNFNEMLAHKHGVFGV